MFDWTTANSNNSFVRDGKLYIVPTLTESILGTTAIVDGYNLNLTLDGTCTSNNISQCSASSSLANRTIINPVQSSRLVTRGKISINRGKVEVRARMPRGYLSPQNWCKGSFSD